MTTSKKDRRKQVKALKKAHDQRAKLISKVASARKKFEKRSSKLQAVETRISELSREVFGNENAPAATNGEAESPAAQNTETMAAAMVKEQDTPSAADQPATSDTSQNENPPTG